MNECDNVDVIGSPDSVIVGDVNLFENDVNIPDEPNIEIKTRSSTRIRNKPDFYGNPVTH